MRVVSGLAAILLLAGCHQASEVSADHAWVRLPGVGGRPGSAYFTLHGGATPATLVAVSAPFAVSAEMHETMADMAMPAGHAMAPAMTMAPLKDVAVPAHGEVAFAASGRHLMVEGLKQPIKAGDRLAFTLTFERAGPVQALFAADPMAGMVGMDMHH